MTHLYDADIVCPACQFRGSRVVDTRGTAAAHYIRRRRECLKCEHRFTTHEMLTNQKIVSRLDLGVRLTELGDLVTRLRDDLCLSRLLALDEPESDPARLTDSESGKADGSAKEHQ